MCIQGQWSYTTGAYCGAIWTPPPPAPWWTLCWRRTGQRWGRRQPESCCSRVSVHVPTVLLEFYFVSFLAHIFKEWNAVPHHTRIAHVPMIVMIICVIVCCTESCFLTRRTILFCTSLYCIVLYCRCERVVASSGHGALRQEEQQSRCWTRGMQDAFIQYIQYRQYVQYMQYIQYIISPLRFLFHFWLE